MSVFQSVTGNRLTIFNNGLLGQGEVIACADTGIDMDVSLHIPPRECGHVANVAYRYDKVILEFGVSVLQAYSPSCCV